VIRVCVCVCVCVCVFTYTVYTSTNKHRHTQYMATNCWTNLGLNPKLYIVNSKQLDQSGLGGPFRKLSPFAAMYMVYLLISHGMP
jgi:hypothetical protein